MLRRMRHLFPFRRSSLAVALAILGMLLASPYLFSQWIKHPTAGVPRQADGAVNMSAPAPRMADGKPDFSGIWTTAEPNRRRAGSASTTDAATSDDKPADPTAIAGSRQMTNLGVDLPGGVLPYQPWLVPIVKERTANNAKDDPHVRCWPDNFIRAYGMPHMLKFVHSLNLLVMLNE